MDDASSMQVWMTSAGEAFRHASYPTRESKEFSRTQWRMCETDAHD